MGKKLRELERILDIPSKEVRRAELCYLARSLGMLPKNNPSGTGFSDQKIVVAIYDGFLRQEKQSQKNRKMAILITAAAVLIAAILAVVPRSAINYFRYLQAKYKKHDKAFEGLDDQGQVVRDEKGQPVLFKQMEGIYDEYYDQGGRHFTYRYVAGQVREMTEFDREGNIISHIVYDEHGNPVLERR